MVKRSREAVINPIARVHPALGIRPLKQSEAVLALTESSLPSWWLELDDSDRWDLKHQYFGLLLDQIASGPVNFDVHLSDGDQLSGLLDLGARRGADPFSAHGEIDRSMWEALIDTDPSELTLYDRRGGRLMSVFDTWDGAFIYEATPALHGAVAVAPTR